MNQAMESAPAGICPRCRSATIEIRSTSPVAGIWTVFGCATCLYAWRSTEPDENTSPDKYPAAFRLKPEELEALPVAPGIPRRARSDDGSP